MIALYLFIFAGCFFFLAACLIGARMARQSYFELPTEGER